MENKIFTNFSTATLFCSHHNKTSLQEKGLYAWPVQIENRKWFIGIYDKNSKMIDSFKEEDKKDNTPS